MSDTEARNASSEGGLGLPPGSCDCHIHVFGREADYPLAAGASYRPAPTSLDELAAMHAKLGIERVVLVQPSIYGTDNRCLVDSLAALGERARGVAVVPPDISEADLRQLHEAGVRGTRLNVAAGGAGGLDATRDALRRTAASIAGLGWHLQLFATSAVLGELIDTIEGLPVEVVFDHYARGADRLDHPGLAERIAAMLGEGRAYVKLSASYLVSSSEDRTDLRDRMKVFVQANPERTLWGSNWPHIKGGVGVPVGGIAERDAIDEVRELNLFRDGFEREVDFARAMAANPATLYGF